MPGDVLLTVKGAGVGKINFAPSNEVAIGRQLMAIRPNPAKLFQDFLFYFLKNRFSHFQSIATATTVPGFKKEDVKNLNIPILSLEKQRDIVAYLDNLQAKLDGLKQLQAQTAAELDALLPSILDKAFKGEL
jgi:type I restriction enzyme S subunit